MYIYIRSIHIITVCSDDVVLFNPHVVDEETYLTFEVQVVLVERMRVQTKPANSSRFHMPSVLITDLWDGLNPMSSLLGSLIVLRMMIRISIICEASGRGTRRQITARSVGHECVLIATDWHGGRRYTRIQLRQRSFPTRHCGGAQQLLPQAATAILDPLQLRLEEHNLLLQEVNSRVFRFEDCR